MVLVQYLSGLAGPNSSAQLYHRFHLRLIMFGPFETSGKSAARCVLASRPEKRTGHGGLKSAGESRLDTGPLAWLSQW